MPAGWRLALPLAKTPTLRRGSEWNPARCLQHQPCHPPAEKSRADPRLLGGPRRPAGDARPCSSASRSLLAPRSPRRRWRRSPPPAGRQATAAPGSLSWLLGRRLLTVDLGSVVVKGRVDRPRLERLLRRRLRPVRTITRGRARITYRLARDRAARDALALGPRGGTVEVAGRALSATVRAPVVRQRLRNDCESVPRCRSFSPATGACRPAQACSASFAAMGRLIRMTQGPGGSGAIQTSATSGARRAAAWPGASVSIRDPWRRSHDDTAARSTS